MAKFRMVNTRFWEDDYISRLDPTEKLIYLYVITNPHSTLSGIYEIPLRIIAAETGIDSDMISLVFNRFASNEKIKYQNGWIAIKNFKKHHMGGGKDFQAGVEKDLKNSPQWAIDFIENKTVPTLSIDSPPPVSSLALASALSPALITANAEKINEDLEIEQVDDNGDPYTPRFKRKPKDKNADITLEEAKKRYGYTSAAPVRDKTHIAAMHNSGFTDEAIFAEVDRLQKEEFWLGKSLNFGIVRTQIGGIKPKKRTLISDKTFGK